MSAAAPIQLDLFAPELREWVDAQLTELGLKPGDANYGNAVQAAERGWSAHSIRILLWPATGESK